MLKERHMQCALDLDDAASAGSVLFFFKTHEDLRHSDLLSLFFKSYVYGPGEKRFKSHQLNIIIKKKERCLRGAQQLDPKSRSRAKRNNNFHIHSGTTIHDRRRRTKSFIANPADFFL